MKPNTIVPANPDTPSIPEIIDVPGSFTLPFTREIYLFSTHIAGTSHVQDIQERIKDLNTDSLVSFIREPENKYDKQAIRIENDKKEKLGYVPRNDNPVFSRLMDAGKLLFGKIKNIDTQSYVKIDIDIYLKD